MNKEAICTLTSLLLVSGCLRDSFETPIMRPDGTGQSVPGGVPKEPLSGQVEPEFVRMFDGKTLTGWNTTGNWHRRRPMRRQKNFKR